MLQFPIVITGSMLFIVIHSSHKVAKYVISHKIADQISYAYLFVKYKYKKKILFPSCMTNSFASSILHILLAKFITKYLMGLTCITNKFSFLVVHSCLVLIKFRLQNLLYFIFLVFCQFLLVIDLQKYLIHDKHSRV